MIMTGKQLKHAIKRKGLTQSYCAKQIGITPTQLGQLLNHEKQISKSKLYRLYELLGLQNDITYGALKLYF